jgi:hypothetical protein
MVTRNFILTMTNLTFAKHARTQTHREGRREGDRERELIHAVASK